MWSYVRDNTRFRGLQVGQAWPDKQHGNPQWVWRHVLVRKRVSRKFLCQCPHTLSYRQDTIACRHNIGCQPWRSISEILNSGSSLIGGGGGWMWLGIGFGVAGSNIETWITGCTVQRLSGSYSMTEWVPGHARIFIQSKEFLSEFLGRLSHREELGLDICLCINLEFQGQKSLGISISLVLMLSCSNVLPQLLV